MPTRWQKRGLLFAPASDKHWFKTHAALPIAEHLRGDIFRVYFSGRDEHSRARIGFVDVDIVDPSRPQVSSTPVLDLGTLGAFDDSGVTSSCIVDHDGAKYLYYSGWSLGVTVPFYFYIGLAISTDGGRAFERVTQAPIVERNAVDPYLTASPYVRVDGRTWKMWYVSGSGWSIVDGAPRHRYHIKYAESRNGIDWDRDGSIAIDYKDESEYALARPCVLRDGDLYKMWFSARGTTYRIGYAESKDGRSWKRNDDEVEIVGPQSETWDAEMNAYPFVFDHGGRRYMLYNGNGYGRSGIGYAVSEGVDLS